MTATRMIPLVTCTRCKGTGLIDPSRAGLLDACDPLNATLPADKRPPLADRRCVRCSGARKHGVECEQCGAPRPSHTFFCPTKNWPSEDDPAPQSARAEVDEDLARRQRGEPSTNFAWRDLTDPALKARYA